MKYITLQSRPDRLGSNITMYIAQVLFAHHYKYYIRYNLDTLKYRESCFIKTLISIIDAYNTQYIDTPTVCMPFIEGDWSQQIGGVTQLIQSDHISAFQLLRKSSTMVSEWDIPFDPKKSIVIHLRLEDVAHLKECDGTISSNFYRDAINNGGNMTHKHSVNFPNHQSPLAVSTIQTRINLLQKKYPEREIILITNPGSTCNLPYRIIRSPDESYDLFLLSKAEIVVLSRSTFALSSLYFGSHIEVHIPLIGFLVMFGLSTKFDKNSYVYF